MSLRYASRVVLRAAQAVRARQPPARPMAGAVKPGGTAPAAQRPQGGHVSAAGGGRSSVSAEKAIAVDKLRRRKAQKAENVMHLVCWGPN
ncbi:hypothetical protein BAE44_0012805 [Dichanthelium oligosanthes]|uniref:Uncharacterized protein n=1 Tax=Dichanthelium oligosanthes TaxID=888268 RepID=A0A1E5VM91_9POAL|nr:hypothetical protein BAE44_0012805 [Dichanthelium oligosanthes]